MFTANSKNYTFAVVFSHFYNHTEHIYVKVVVVLFISTTCRKSRRFKNAIYRKQQVEKRASYSNIKIENQHNTQKSPIHSKRKINILT